MKGAGVRTVRNFANVKKGQAAALQPCTKHSLQKYIEFMNIICKASPLKEVDNTSLLWLWVILSCYESIEYSTSIAQNSCNAGVTFLECTTPSGKKERLVVKFQLNPYADNIALDNINGYIVNRIIEFFPRLRYHFMRYVDSCVTFVDATNKQKNEFHLDRVLLASQRMIDDDDLISGLAELKAEMKRCPISICRSVNSPESLQDMIDSDDYDFDALLEKLADLFHAMRAVGNLFGFTHNDAHLANVLYDGKENSFVLIDYGRLLFSSTLLKAFDKELDRDITDQLLFERFKQLDDAIVSSFNCSAAEPAARVQKMTYTNFVKTSETMSEFLAVPRLHFLCEQKGYDFLIRNLYLFDIMCISMNLLVEVSSSTEDDNHSMFVLFDDYATFHDDDTPLITISSVEAMYRRLRQTNGSASKKMILCLGFFWYAFLIEYLFRISPELEEKGIITYNGKNDTYVVDTKALAREGIVWHKMQVLYLPHLESFCEIVNRNKAVIQKFIELVMVKNNDQNNDRNARSDPQSDYENAYSDVQSQSGAGVSKPSRTLQTKVKRVNKSKFRKEYRAYASGGSGEGDETQFDAMFRAYAPSNAVDYQLCNRYSSARPGIQANSSNINKKNRGSQNTIFQFNV